MLIVHLINIINLEVIATTTPAAIVSVQAPATLNLNLNYNGIDSQIPKYGKSAESSSLSRY